MENTLESFPLGPFRVPRLWNGLWQLSSNAWGSAPIVKVRAQMSQYVEQGYTAFDMADHYGSSEIIFGQFRRSRQNTQRIVGATKWCVFRPTNPTRVVVEAAVQERLDRMQTDCIDLLQVFLPAAVNNLADTALTAATQFHWQDYNDKGYLTALRHLQDLQQEGRITTLGLCNFDAIRTDEICCQLGPGSIVSNQVQFSLIDTRPLHGMADVCQRHNVRLLTYGTLCGGFLADQWLGQPEPDAYSGRLTPSQRKYLDMIVKAWGDWTLFQSLLVVLRQIGDRHGGVSIANVATRWVLDYPCVGAVIIGARLGVSEHRGDNSRVFTFQLTQEDNAAIDAVLEQSNGRHLITAIGDCGAEYR